MCSANYDESMSLSVVKDTVSFDEVLSLPAWKEWMAATVEELDSTAIN